MMAGCVSFFYCGELKEEKKIKQNKLKYCN